MTGVELVVGGWIAKPVIGNILSRARSYLHDNFSLHKGTEKMLNDLEAALPRIEAVIDAAEQRSTGSNALSTWLQQLKDAVSNTEDVLDDFEAKAIKDQVASKNKVSAKVYSGAKALKTWLFSDSDFKKLKDAVRKLEYISAGVDSFIALVKLNDDESRGRIGCRWQSETSSLLGDTKLIGRDEEISLILDIILGYNYLPKPSDHAQGDGQPEYDQMGSIFDRLRNIFRTGMAESSERRLENEAEKSSGKGEHEELEASKMGMKLEELDINKKGIKIEEHQTNQKGQTVTLDSTYEAREAGDASPNLGVLPIVGISGVGKTAVAQAIFNNIRVKICFDLTAWVYVSDNITEKQIVQKIIMSLEPWSGLADAALDLDNLQRKLMDIIRSKRLLLVLDDVCDEIIIVWDRLRSILRSGAPQSMVLVTTQKYSVANLVGTVGPITLNTLGQTHFWKLFKHLLFDDNVYYGAASTYERIANKLHGLPLAAKIVAPLLRANSYSEYWERVLKNDWWNVANHGMGINILPALGMGYYC